MKAKPIAQGRGTKQEEIFRLIWLARTSNATFIDMEDLDNNRYHLQQQIFITPSTYDNEQHTKKAKLVTTTSKSLPFSVLQIHIIIRHYIIFCSIDTWSVKIRIFRLR